MATRFTNVSAYIRGIIGPIIAGLNQLFAGGVARIATIKLRLTGGATSPTVEYKTGAEDCDIPSTVVPDKHKHTTESLDMVDITKHCVVRDATGNIKSSGTQYGTTGYKLLNGEDLSTLFVKKSDGNFTVDNSFSNVSGGTASGVNQRVVASAYLSRSGNKITLVKTFTNVCVCHGSANGACRCCD